MRRKIEKKRKFEKHGIYFLNTVFFINITTALSGLKASSDTSEYW